MREGDLILEFDGRKVAGIDDLHKPLTDERINRAVPVTVIRRAEKITPPLVPQESP